MGAGKSTIGRLLAQELKLEFVDSDRVIEERAGADIPWIFDVEGEAGFRQREANVIEQLTEQDNQVLATGGGVVMREDNRAHLQGRGTVVYLTTSIEQQLERTSRDKNRPLLQQPNPEEVLTNLMELRHPLYTQVADFSVVTDKRNPRSVVSEIIELLQQKNIIK